MCGIIGYKGPQDAVGIALAGLQRLEYRGYDSWGIAALQDHKLLLMKRTGTIGGIARDELPMSGAHLALGHTRWATHGGVTEANAHPHLSQSGRIALVHNGIVENHQELREHLQSEGFTFVSQTDTEVIAHLLDLKLRSLPLKEALIATLAKMEGSFAIVLIDRQDGTMAGARNGSPLVVGHSAQGDFLASDVPAFLEHARQVTYLNDGEMAIITDHTALFSYVTGAPIKRTPETITWSLEQAQKGSFDHFMRKEIAEQSGTIRKAIEQDPHLWEAATTMLKEAFGIFFVGAGTSFNSCISASYVFSEVAGKHVNTVFASEFGNYRDFLTPKTLMVAVSQSGETADLLDAVKAAKAKGVKVLAIVNVMGSTLMRQADATILMNAGPEICVLSTKSYTSQVAILLALAYRLAGKGEEGRQLIIKAAEATDGILDAAEPIAKKLATQLRQSHDLFLIGRDLAYPSALEGALKIKEVSYIHAEGFAGGELKHGTIALIAPGVPTIALVTEATKSLILSNATEIKSRGGHIIGIAAQPNPLFDTYFKVPAFSHADPITMILPIQLLAYHLALERGCDPDKPRNLAKSVTVK